MANSNNDSLSQSLAASTTPSMRITLSRAILDRSHVSARLMHYKFANPKLDEETQHISRNAMRRALAVSRASRASIRARILVAATELHEMEELMGLLRAKHAILQSRETDADEQIGHVLDVLEQSGIAQFSQSDDEDDAEGEGYHHSYFADKAHYPPTSDLPVFDSSNESLSDSDLANDETGNNFLKDSPGRALGATYNATVLTTALDTN